MTIDYKLIGKRIKDIRTSQKKTQENLAEYMDVSVGYVSQLERGITKISLDRLAIICSYLNCDISDILNGSSTKSSEYMNKEIQELYSQLNGQEKLIVYELLKTYFHIMEK